MKYKIGFLTFLVSLAIYTPALGADYLYNQPLTDTSNALFTGSTGQATPIYATTTAPGTVRSLSFFDAGLFNNPTTLTFRVLVADSASTTLLGISDPVTVSRVATDGTTTVTFTGNQQFGFFNAGVGLKIIPQYQSGQGSYYVYYQPVGGIGDFKQQATFNIRSDLSTNGNSVVPAFPVNFAQIKATNWADFGVYASTTQNNTGIYYDLIDPAGNFSTHWQFTLTVPVTDQLLTFQMPLPTAGNYQYRYVLRDMTTGTALFTSAWQDFTVLGSVPPLTGLIATSTFSHLSLSWLVGSTTVESFGLTYKTCGALTDYQTWGGCLYNVGLDLLTAVLIPNSFTLDTFGSALTRFQNTFPFSLFFNFSGTLTSALNTSVKPTAVVIPANEITGQFAVFSADTLTNLIGATNRDAWFDFISNAVWFVVGVKSVMLFL